MARRRTTDARYQPERTQRRSGGASGSYSTTRYRSAPAFPSSSRTSSRQRTAERSGSSSSAAPRQGARSYTSTSVGELRQRDRNRARSDKPRRSRRWVVLVALVALVVALVAGWVALSNSSAFAIEEVRVNGVEHLTGEEMAQLANVPADTTLLRVDIDTIDKRVRRNAWVEDVQINRVFPNTLEINVTERAIAAIVEIPLSSSTSVKSWAIAADHVWLMPIPEAGSDAAKTTSAKVYEDAEAALHIVDVPYGTRASIGEVCTDRNVNNALDIVSNLTTELADHIVEISAATEAETMLILDSGVEVAFGAAEDIRDKERVVLEILAENGDGVSYINVRMVETPTWRAI